MNAAEQLGRIFPDEHSAALITYSVSLRYLCGAEVNGGIALISKEERFLFVSGEVSLKASGFKVVVLRDFRQILDILVKYGIKRLYVENDKVTLSELDFFKNTLHYADFVTTGELTAAIMKLRAIKSENEIQQIKKAQNVCDKVYQQLLGTVRKGMTERQISSYITYHLIEFGADEPAFPVKVLSGANTALVDGRPTSRQICEGDFLLLEFGAKVGGYCAVMSRTVAVGKISSAQEDLYNAVSCAVFDGLKTLRAEINSKVPDSVARATLNAWRAEKYLHGGFIHGIGLEPNEIPFTGDSLLLKSGMTVSAGCDVRISGKIGVKIADTCALTPDGCRNFTTATRELVHI